MMSPEVFDRVHYQADGPDLYHSKMQDQEPK